MPEFRRKCPEMTVFFRLFQEKIKKIQANSGENVFFEFRRIYFCLILGDFRLNSGNFRLNVGEFRLNVGEFRLKSGDSPEFRSKKKN